jgi:hypothetical protein
MISVSFILIVTNVQWRTQEFFSVGSTNSVEDRGQMKRGFGGDSSLVGFRPICKWVKPIFLLGYRCIFHGTGNSAQLCQNLGISGEQGGLNPSNTPLSMPLLILHSLQVVNKRAHIEFVCLGFSGIFVVICVSFILIVTNIM